LLDALARLKAEPELLGGDPADLYTYEDPILAIAAEYIRRSATAPVASAADGRKLRNRNVLPWVLTAIRAWRARGDLAFGALGGRTPTEPISFSTLPLRIAVLGDAGFQCTAQQRVLRAIKSRHAKSPFNLGVHLGDTYFAGTEAEVLVHLLKPLSEVPFRFTSLCGNHDLLHGPAGYAATISVLKQPGRYFEIEAPGWRIACLDTSLGCERVLRNDGTLDHGQLEWLDRLLAKDGSMILMSHHYIVSDWSDPMESLLAQLRDRLADRVVAWYWGHEHNLVAYRKSPYGFAGACVGNGAFLEKRRDARKDQSLAEWVSPGNCNCYPKNGWLELEITADAIKETYHLEGQTAAYERTITRSK